ncbi:MAG: carboxymuconolactone decarboxylase family protein [Acidobacteria bacterium]|jgi:4-carboxymuconolactone decarboxylase|nr:MAG: carboxymuconolactone decarboxylase family protein [Acidobacteriota bacterium]
MSDSERRKRGEATIKDVYAGDVVVPPEGAMPFADIMLETLFAEVWTREVLSMRDRRLLLLGAIAALGEQTTFGIQAKAAIKKQELTPEQLREVAVFLVHYVGYPRGASLIGPIEKAIQEAEAS